VPTSQTAQSSRFLSFYRFTLAVLAVTLLVILWGGFVRATGAGAGCGNHWPTCNGQIIPRSPGGKTLVEFTHRLTSGLSLLMIVAQLVWARRLFPARHEVRRTAWAVLGLILLEALIGGGLVIFEMVAGNTSVARGYWMAAHLLNTFALLATMAVMSLRAQRAAGRAQEIEPGAGLPVFLRAVGAGAAALVLVAMSGAVVALGDTLFPATSLAHGLAQDLSPSAHLFVRLRVVHPILAVSSALYLLVICALLAARDSGGQLRKLATRVALLVLAQVCLGLTNMVLLAPVPLQLAHLLVADLLWLAVVTLTAAMARAASRAPAAAALPGVGDLSPGV
jgi:cytochrome c oxidase assembly protein subunit 15